MQDHLGAVLLPAVLLVAQQTPTPENPTWPGMAALEQAVGQYDLGELVGRWCQQRAEWLDASRARFRLSSYDYTLHQPLAAPTLALGWTDDWIESARKRLDLESILRGNAGGLDLNPEEVPVPEALLRASTPFLERMDLLEALLVSAAEDVESALAEIGPDQRKELRKGLPLLVRDLCQTVQILDRPEHLATLNLVQGVQRNALLRAALRLAPLATERFGRSLYDSFAASRPARPRAEDRPEGIDGRILWARECSVGWMIVGGGGSNSYDMPLAFLLEIGGDEHYSALATRAEPEQPVNVVIDLEGSDRYANEGEAGAGMGLLGVSLLVDHKGDDDYSGRSMGQGAGLGGVGILVDHEGNDEYEADALAQGAAIFGLGLLIDRGGDDFTRAAFASQGFGGPAALGLLLDLRGNDQRLAGQKYPSSQLTPGEFSAYSMGVGLGLRSMEHPQAAAGGIGLLVDALGDDRYEVGEFGFGTGYFLGTGVVRDVRGNDEVHASRFGIASAAHLGLGLVLDDAGDDLWSNPHPVSCGAAWDLGLAFLLDASGDDRYRAQGLGPASASITSLAVVVDAGGRDDFSAAGLMAFGNGGHELDVTRQTKSLSFFLDLGGEVDTYPDSPLRPRPADESQTLRRHVNSAEGVTKETGVGFFVDR